VEAEPITAPSRTRCMTCDKFIKPGETYCNGHKPKHKCRNWLCEFPGKFDGFCIKHYEQNLAQGAE